MAERKGGQGLGYHSVSQSGVADNKLLPKVRQDGPLRLKDRQRSTKKLKAGWYCVAMFAREPLSALLLSSPPQRASQHS